MKLTALNRLKMYAALICPITLLCLIAPCHADQFATANEILGFSNNKPHHRITPTHLMDNKTLFRAAAAERDNSMSMHQKQINFYWLAYDGKQQKSGAEAMRKIVRDGLRAYWKRDRAANATAQNLNREENPRTFRNLDNYRLQLSDDKLVVGFRYQF
ncbi:MAG: hypothetical protein ACI93R_003320 [Flavobacteriales bacterium]|jgi:hypothetical protein